MFNVLSVFGWFQFAAIKIPYPEDKLSKEIDAQEKEAVSCCASLLEMELNDHDLFR